MKLEKLLELLDHSEMAEHLGKLLVDLSGEIVDRENEDLPLQLRHTAKKLHGLAARYRRNVTHRISAANK